MRILEIETFGRGGLTHYAFNLCGALARRGHDVVFVTGAGYELEGRDESLPDVPVEKVIGRFTQRPPSGVPGVVMSVVRKAEAITDGFKLARVARRLRPDIVHLHCTNPIALHYLRQLKKIGCPVVATAHVVTPHEPIRFQQAVYDRLHRAADLVIAHSEVDRGRLLDEFGLAPERVRVIPHGEYGFFERGGEPLDRDASRAALGLEPDDEVALFFGYIREYKGLDVLLEAWSAVAEARPNARLLIAGDPVRLAPARRRELEDWADRLGAIHRFGYVPFDDVTQYFGAADVLVMPYRRISQSGVLFLALSVGLPVVASAVGALPEMLVDRESALLVAPESPGALADALREALGDATLRATLADGAREVARAHSWEAIAETTEKAFEELLS